MSTTMAHDIRTPPFRQWSFEKAMLEFQHGSPSESSTADVFEHEEKVRIMPTSIAEHKRSIPDQKSPPVFNERYMSSEEALSPTDNEEDYSDAESIYTGETSIRFGVCDMAVAICIISVGRAKVVEVPVPSLTSSPSIGSDVERPTRTDSIPLASPPPRSILRQRGMERPVLRTLNSSSSYSDLKSHTAQQSPSYSFSTKEYESHSRRNSIFRSFTNQPFTASPSLNSPASINSAQPSFLSQDPFANSTPPRQHSRLRNISQKLGRFALHSKQQQQAEPSPTQESLAPALELRRTSISSNPRRGSVSNLLEQLTPESSPALKRKMVPRGASERAAPIEIPPCPYDLDEDGDIIKRDRVRRRKSLMGF